MTSFPVFPKETDSKDENRIDRIAAEMGRHGFSQDVLVLRNSFDVSLALLASSLGGLKGEYARAVFPRGNCVVIATQEKGDGDLIRAKMTELRPTFLAAFPHLKPYIV